MSETTVTDVPPGASHQAVRVARAVFRPLERFLHIQAASGIVLVVAAVIALGWANSPWAGTYSAVFEAPIQLGIGGHGLEVSVRFVINDVLMAIFFFVVGLEIRREMHAGELSDLRRAALPIAAAIGGMIVPALIYLAFNPSGPAASGWGVPMATDIAFAVGVLALLGSRVPPSLRVFLLALAIIDDIGAILVIAVFYSSGIELTGLGIALLGIAAIVGLQRFGVRRVSAYVVPAAVVWAGVYSAGIHPTIAGVIVGLLTPAVAWYGPRRFVASAREDLGQIAEITRQDAPTPDFSEPMTKLRRSQREVLSPVERIESAMHPWVAFGIMPVFALANAGVNVGDAGLGTMPLIAVGIAAGLVVGKLVGVLAASMLAVKLGIASLPRGATWRGVGVVGLVAGIGFTMALFIAELAFAGRPALHGVAKIGVLLASAAAALATLVVGRLLLDARPVPGAAETVEEAESSTER
ncbi:MAG: Na+/H+ antiporter NhaA [Deltaproteobacteria bacterium]|nr:Na+/H+ antiporter NhaA [Deltaproteobacteria bacterium]